MFLGYALFPGAVVALSETRIDTGLPMIAEGEQWKITVKKNVKQMAMSPLTKTRPNWNKVEEVDEEYDEIDDVSPEGYFRKLDV